MDNDETKLIQDGPPKFMNVELQIYISNRTVQAINKEFQRQDYKTAVHNFPQQDRSSFSSSSDEDQDFTDIPPDRDLLIETIILQLIRAALSTLYLTYHHSLAMMPSGTRISKLS